NVCLLLAHNSPTSHCCRTSLHVAPRVKSEIGLTAAKTGGQDNAVKGQGPFAVSVRRRSAQGAGMSGEFEGRSLSPRSRDWLAGGRGRELTRTPSRGREALASGKSFK